MVFLSCGLEDLSYFLLDRLYLVLLRWAATRCARGRSKGREGDRYGKESLGKWASSSSLVSFESCTVLYKRDCRSSFADWLPRGRTKKQVFTDFNMSSGLTCGPRLPLPYMWCEPLDERFTRGKWIPSSLNGRVDAHARFHLTRGHGRRAALRRGGWAEGATSGISSKSHDAELP